MASYKIAVIVGSLRRESINRMFATALGKLAPPEFEWRHVDIGDLPLYNQDTEENPGAAVVRFKEEIFQSQGLVFVTPEYNRSVPGVLKNALDHASRPYGKNVWAGKPAGVVGVSVGAIGTAISQQHLRTVLAYLDAPTLGQPEVFVKHNKDIYGTDGAFNADMEKFMRGWMTRYASWVKQHSV